MSDTGQGGGIPDSWLGALLMATVTAVGAGATALFNWLKQVRAETINELKSTVALLQEQVKELKEQNGRLVAVSERKQATIDQLLAHVVQWRDEVDDLRAYCRLLHDIVKDDHEVMRMKSLPVRELPAMPPLREHSDSLIEFLTRTNAHDDQLVKALNPPPDDAGHSSHDRGAGDAGAGGGR